MILILDQMDRRIEAIESRIDGLSNIITAISQNLPTKNY